MHHTTHHELSHWLRLTQVPGVGSRTIQKLLTVFHSVEAITNASDTYLRQLKWNDEQIKTLKNPDQKKIDDALLWENTSKNHHIIPYADCRYPPLLLETAHFPAILYVHGDCQLLLQPQIAMVGSRKPSHTGLELALEFSHDLVTAGLIVTSGLAIGIDGASHQGALNGHGQTIAVLGSGLDHIYPKRHFGLAEQIVQNGCLISELPLTTQPLAANFPKRNRIISGLSLGTLVVEATPQSGSLITARFAMEQNREVFAIPGSPRNPMAKGCLSLIQQGAKCVTQVSDVLEEINISQGKLYVNLNTTTLSTTHQMLDSTEQLVLACIEDLTSIDQICARSKLSAQMVMATVLQLELKDIVKGQHGGYIKVTGNP